ncbi:MAG: hypothetical protein LC105_13035 [Chitinophagales bacterium]|nr:hypothetical protein [Chitinophagales bacterium]
MISYVSKVEINKGEEVHVKDIRAAIFDFIKGEFPDISVEDYISIAELNYYRRHFLTYLIEQEKGEIAAIDKDVLTAIQKNSILSENIQDELEKELSLGQRVADSVASFGGSWTFIIFFFFL